MLSLYLGCLLCFFNDLFSCEKKVISISISINLIFCLPSLCGLYIWHFSSLFGSILLQLLTAISTIDDLNYPEKTDTYYIVNAPYIFSACWKVCVNTLLWKKFTSFATKCLMLNCWQVVKPLLQERTRRKIQVLQGCGRDELLKVSMVSICI